MQTSRVTSKYQATIPQKIRAKLNLQAGENELIVKKIGSLSSYDRTVVTPRMRKVFNLN